MAETDGRGPSRRDEHSAASQPLASLGRMIGRVRYVVLLGVLGVLLLAISLFVLGAATAATSVWHAIQGALRGEVASTPFTVELLEVVSTMLKAVVFFLVAVGLYSLFIAPLSLPEALGVETLYDLETKLVSVIIVILAITFLEHFIRWEQPVDTLQFGIAMALVVACLVFFQTYLHRAKQAEMADSRTQMRAQQRLFEEDREMGEIPSGRPAGDSADARRE